MKRFINGVNDFTELDKAKRQLELLKENKFKMNYENQIKPKEISIADKLFVIAIILFFATTTAALISLWI
tara:strand:- start:136 stop:345 length:210 start_codon:yes stop_codon:yes gene_type:complete